MRNNTEWGDTKCYPAYSLIIPPLSFLYSAVFIICGIVAASGNTLVLIVLRKHKMRKNMHLILTSLAVSDALVGYVLCPYLTYQMMETDTLTNCRFKTVRNFIVYMICGSSSVNVLIIAFNRYLSLTKLMNYNKYMNKKKMLRLVALSWFVPNIIMVADVIGEEFGVTILYEIARILIATLLFGILVVIVFLYFITVTIVRKSVANKIHHTKHLGIESNMAKSSRLLIFCFVLCFMPGVVSYFIPFMSKDQNKVRYSLGYHHYTIFTLVMASANSCINPIIYTMQFPAIRKNLKNLLFTWLQKTDSAGASE